MELFEVSTSLKQAGSVPEPSERDIAQARARFLAAIAAEAAPRKRSQGSAA